jgi:hypothetical protein
MDMRELGIWVAAVLTQIGMLGKRALMRVGISLALVSMVFTGTFAQIGQAGIGATPVAFAAGSRLYQASHEPNTLSKFRASGSAWESHPSQGPSDDRHLVVGSGQRPEKGPSATGKPSAHPVSIALASRFFSSSAAQAGGHSPTVPDISATHTWFKNAEGTLEAGLVEGSLDLRQATIAGKPLTADPLLLYLTRGRESAGRPPRPVGRKRSLSLLSARPT